MFTDFERQFVEHTMLLLEGTNWENYEVTSLLNFSMGLLVYPKGKLTKQQWTSKQAERLTTDYDLSSWHITKDNKQVNLSFYETLRHTRNALSHSGIEVFEWKDKEKRIVLTDENQEDGSIVKLEVKITELSRFAREAAYVYLNYKTV